MPNPRARLGVESLELRDCPATASVTRGVLTVVGTEGNDVISVTRSGDWVGAAGQWFHVSGIGKLVITVGGGNDVIRDQSDLSAVIYGGVGNDRIYAGRGHDVIYGGHGDDVIYGERGSDTIWGGGGTDVIDGGAGDDAVNYGSPQLTAENSTEETEIIRLVNRYRRANGLAPLAVSAKLNAAAALHSRDMMAVSNTSGPWAAMQHHLFGTTRPLISDRLDAVGYDTWTRFFRYGENIAFGYATAAQVVEAWISSPAHRASILNPAFTETGVSIRVDALGQRSFTQDFGRSV
ncbi:MAG TPA: CAP domain-containing protein [Gemmata sp.]|nr:CAP domain-containing protein [Gemmata sp.]